MIVKFNNSYKKSFDWGECVMNCNQDVLERIKGGIIVSCQALEDEPLHSSFIMMRMAKAAQMGGAVGIRANTLEDCREIKKNVDLPMIAIYKKVFADSNIYITPTIEEFKTIMNANVEIIAVDATKRERPDGKELEEYIKEIRKVYSGLLMADVSSYEEGIKAANLGFDIVGTTLSGYTDYTLDFEKPNYDLIEKLSSELSIPVIAEGNIETPEQAAECFRRGAFAIVVGGAITRPQLITRKFADAIKHVEKEERKRNHF